MSGERKKKLDATGVCARTGATGDSAHRAYLLQRVIRGVEVFDILFARVRYRNAIAGGQRERLRGGKNARRVGGEVTTFDEPRDSGLGVFFVSAARSLARTLWMSFFFGFRSPYFALSFSSCCRMISSGEGWRGGGVGSGQAQCDSRPSSGWREKSIDGSRGSSARTSGSMVFTVSLAKKRRRSRLREERVGPTARSREGRARHRASRCGGGASRRCC